MAATTRTTTCPLDCPDACALDVEVTDGRVTRIGAAADSAHTAGFICGKVTGFTKRLYHRERILHPLRRVGPKGEGGFERISWDEAIDTIAGNLRAVAERWGGEAILPFHYGGSNGLVTDEFLDFLFFSRLGASRLSKTICALPATQVAQGMYGKMPGVAFSDYPRAKAIVVWGANPRGSNIHLVPYLQQARRRGAWIAQVDPRRTLADSEVDLHLPVLPGQDLPLALALIERWRAAGQLDREFLAGHADGLAPLLEQAAEWPLERAAQVTGLTAAAIAELADRLAAQQPLPGALRLGPRAQPQRRPGDRRGAGDPGAAGKVRGARRRLHAIQQRCRQVRSRRGHRTDRLEHPRPQHEPTGPAPGHRAWSPRPSPRSRRSSSTTPIRPPPCRTSGRCCAGWPATTCSPSSTTR